jgi:hypothetical protein
MAPAPRASDAEGRCQKKSYPAPGRARWARRASLAVYAIGKSETTASQKRPPKAALAPHPSRRGGKPATVQPAGLTRRTLPRVSRASAFPGWAFGRRHFRADGRRTYRPRVDHPRARRRRSARAGLNRCHKELLPQEPAGKEQVGHWAVPAGADVSARRNGLCPAACCGSLEGTTRATSPTGEHAGEKTSLETQRETR